MSEIRSAEPSSVRLDSLESIHVDRLKFQKIRSLGIEI